MSLDPHPLPRSAGSASPFQLPPRRPRIGLGRAGGAQGAEAWPALLAVALGLLVALAIVLANR